MKLLLMIVLVDCQGKKEWTAGDITVNLPYAQSEIRILHPAGTVAVILDKQHHEFGAR
ncbi:MAG: hypothetical protein ABIQ57_15030 [Candidatus Kapaibacterium sp.]